MQRLLWLLVATCLMSPICAEQSAPSQDADSTERLEAMTTRANLLRAEFTDRESRNNRFKLVPQPILRYSDPARQDTDGTVWVFADGEPPVALVCLFVKPDRTKEWNYEFVSLIDQPLRVSGRPRWSWTPRRQTRTWSRLDGDVSDRAVGRAQQMRAIARQMQASEVIQDQSFQLRLLNRPVYRYSDQDRGIEDGALFVYAYGTNPEILLQIESRRSGAAASWFISFARLTSAAAAVERSGRIVWKVDPIEPPQAPGVGGFQPQDPYFSWFGPDPLEEAE